MYNVILMWLKAMHYNSNNIPEWKGMRACSAVHNIHNIYVHTYLGVKVCLEHTLCVMK